MKKLSRVLFLLPLALLWACTTEYETDVAGVQTSEDTGRPASDASANTAERALFNIDKVPVITLTFTEVEWNKLLTNFDLNPKNEKKVVSAFTYTLDGQTTQLNNIGLKLKGNTSRRRPEGSTGQPHNSANPDWHHCHFSLDFAKNIPTQRFAGREKIALKWFKDDANYVREVYSYDLFRRFGIWTAPRASYCRLNIKVGNTVMAYYGVYAMIESVDEDFIAARQNHWGSGIGDMWKGGWDDHGNNANFVSTQSIGVEDVTLDPATSQFFAYDLKTNKDNLASARANLLQFIADLNTKTGAEFNSWIATKMDIPLFLRTYATNVMLGMWDDYWGNGNNFYFYFAPNGKAYFIPYDYDNTLGTSLLMANSGTQNPLQWGADARPLITKILANPIYQNIYKQAIDRLLDPSFDYFHASRSMPRIQAWQNKIGPYVSNDTGEDMSLQDAPAFWGNQPNYRLLSGNDQGGANGPANWFTTRAAHIPW